MDASSDYASLNRLNGVLLDAMNQSRALFSKLEEQTRTIERLRCENEQYQKDLQALKNGQEQQPAADDAAAQLDYLFQQDVVKQAEIERLKKELRKAQKSRPGQALHRSQLASPLTSSDPVDHIPSSRLSGSSNAAHGIAKARPHKRPSSEGHAESVSPANKKRRREEDSALHEVSNNVVDGVRTKSGRKNQSRSEHGAEAIPIIAEDGDDHDTETRGGHSGHHVTEKKQPGLHRRLDALLSATSPSNASLGKPLQRPAKSLSPRTPVVSRPLLLRQSSNEIVTISKPERPPSGMRFLRPARHKELAPEDEEPLRSRPTTRLNLSNFKLNPLYCDQDESARNKEAKKCFPGCTRPECCGKHMRALAMMMGPNLKISEDDLLLDFLGPGSEKKITTLTSVARENLLHEARVKKVANDYGKLHRNGHERATSPTGFWNTDMPGSQEMKQNREEARKWERAEVERRYQEACMADGRWVFADE